MDELWATLSVDGAAWPNPGPAGIGISLCVEGVEILACSEPIGRATNNQAEYRALIEGVRLALELGYRRLCIYTDSRLVASQLRGAWRLKSPNLKPLHAQAHALLAQLEAWELYWRPREFNERADALAADAARSPASAGAAVRF